MDIINLLSGGQESDVSASPNLNIDINSSNIVKTLKGEYSEKKAEPIKPKTSSTGGKGIWKHFNDTLDSILSLMAEKEDSEKEILDRLRELTKKIDSPDKESVNMSSNKELITNIAEIKETVVKTPSEVLREKDDGIAEAKEILTESISEVFENSQVIAHIDESLVNINTKVKDIPTEENENKNNTLWSDINLLLGNMPDKILKGVGSLIAKPFTKLFGLVSALPVIDSVKNFAKEGMEKASSFVKPVTDSFDKAKAFAKEGFDKASSSVTNFFKSGYDKIAGNGLSKTATKEVAEKATKEVATSVATKGVMKSVLKKIPVIGALLGTGFAIPRILDGDYKGATLEFASGVASTLPGVGTAASVGLDAALVARDIKNSTDPSKVDINIDPNKTKKIIDSTKGGNVINENTNVNYTTSNVRNVSLEDREEDFIRASKF
jgi:hypothetical protein